MGIFEKTARFGERFAQELAGTGLGRVINPFEGYNKEQFGKLARMAGDTSLTNIGKNYFTGRQISTIGESGIKYTEASARLASQRKLLYGGVLGLAAANALDINPGGLTDKVNNVAALGAHYTIGKGLMGVNKLAGIGYLGMTAINTFRPGDQIGPM